MGDDLVIMRKLLTSKEQAILNGLKRLGVGKIKDRKVADVMADYNSITKHGKGAFPVVYEDDIEAFGHAFLFFTKGHPMANDKKAMRAHYEDRAEEVKRGLPNGSLIGVNWRGEGKIGG